MSCELLSGTIFELGPDGYGYILDDWQPGSSYAFRVDQISGLSRASGFLHLEGKPVYFSLTAQGKIKDMSLGLLRP